MLIVTKPTNQHRNGPLSRKPKGWIVVGEA